MDPAGPGVPVIASRRLLRSGAALLALWAPRLSAQTPEQAVPERGLALTHVTLIDATGALPQIDMTVVVQGNRISGIHKTGRGPIPPGAETLDGTGLFLLPGLIDTHVHLFSNWRQTSRDNATAYLGGFLAQGVTGIRDAVGDEARLALRNAVETGQILGPHLHVAGEVRHDAIPSGTGTDLRSVTRRRVNQGFDAIKLRSRLRPLEALTIIEEARSLGRPVYGHTTDRDTLPWVDYTLAGVNAGMSGVTHTWFLPTVPTQRELPQPVCTWQQCAAAWWLYHASVWLYTTDQDMEPIIRAMVQRGVWLEPTLAFTDQIAHHDRYAQHDPQGFFDWYHGTDLTRFRSAFNRMMRFVRLFHEAGGSVLAGTDMTDYPLIYELQRLTEAGLPPLAVLQAATRDAARALGWAGRRGTVEVGKEADLLLLEADPLQDVRNVERIRLVIRGGRVLDRATLEALQMKSKAAAAAAKQ